MTVDDAEALAGGASGEATGRNPGSAHVGAEAGTACNGAPKSEGDWLMSQVVERTNMQLAIQCDEESWRARRRWDALR